LVRAQMKVRVTGLLMVPEKVM